MRLHHVTKARKAQGKCRRAGCGANIGRGASYYWFKFKKHPRFVYCEKHPPLKSEMTQSKLSRVYAAAEAIEDAIARVRFDADRDALIAQIEALADALESAASETREVSGEYEQAADGMESAFSGGSLKIDECREKAAGCEAWADELEQAEIEVRQMIESAEDDEDVDLELLAQEVTERAQSALETQEL